MEGLAELLILLLFLLGPLLVGYFLAHLYPVEVLRVLCGTAPPPAADLRQALRAVLRAPASAEDLDLLYTVVDLRREAERAAPAEGSTAP